MIFRILVPVIFLMMATVAMADTYEEGGVVTKKEKSMATRSEGAFSRIIPEISFISATLTGESAQDVNNKNGFGIGLLMDLGHSNAVLETGVMYRQLGTFSNPPASIGSTLNLNYLSLPLIGKYYFSGQEESSAYIKAGFMPSLLVAKSVENDVYSTSYIRGINSFDIQATVGLGGKIAIDGGTDFILEADYARGLFNIDAEGGSIYNSSFTVLAGLGISL